jgi:7-carboxy-7-deazaguanine synthase
MKVKEIFYTIQGEGRNAGRPAVFCRFTGCNLWSGLEEDRATAQCRFCDTDFNGGEKYTEQELIDAIDNLWPDGHNNKLVVFTGGEPALQLTSQLVYRLEWRGFDVAVETNGTVSLPSGYYWRTVSPKAGTELKVTSGDELKVVWPQDIDLAELEKMNFRHRYLQPMDGYPDSLRITLEEVMKRPLWKLSIQTHKIIGVR